jgi:hypothetical protein
MDNDDEIPRFMRATKSKINWIDNKDNDPLK